MRFAEAPHLGESPNEREAVQWMFGVQAGERAAFRQLYYSYHERLGRFISLVTSKPEHLHEWLEKTFLTVWHRAAEFSVDCSVLTWVLGLGCEILMSSSESSSDSSGSPEVRESLESGVAPGFAGMPLEHRITVALTYQMRCSPEEIAHITRSTIEIVNRRLSLALEKLRARTPFSGFVIQRGHPKV